MDIYVLNDKFELTDIVDVFKSLIWTDRYQKAGEFEILAPMNIEYLNIFKMGYYLSIHESDHSMIIEKIQIKTSAEDGNSLIITGRSLESILDRRIIWNKTTIKGSLQDGFEQLINEAIINPSDESRKIDNFVFKKNTDESITKLTIDIQCTGDNLYDVIQSECVKNKIGFMITINSENKFEFSLYSGKDRSYDQTSNPYVVFSPKFDNLISSDYTESKRNYKNVTLVAGEGEGDERIKITVGDFRGIDRRELYTDARDLQSQDADGYYMDDEDYLKILEERGKTKLLESTDSTVFDGNVEPYQMYKYGEDYFIGDVIQIENEYQKEGKATITEYIISQEESGILSIYPKFETVKDEQ